jgi:hypothetical protein
VRVDGCQSVVCDRSFISGVGDGITIESGAVPGTARETRGISIVETTVLATDCALRVGPATRKAVRDVLIRDSDVIQAAQGVSVTAGQGSGGIEGLVVRDTTMRLRSIDGPGGSGRPFYVANSTDAPIRNLLFDRVQTDAANSSQVLGSAGSRIEDIKFWGVRITADSQRRAGPRPLFELRGVSGPQFRFLYVTWPPDRALCWTEIVQARDTTDLKAPPDEIFQNVRR